MCTMKNWGQITIRTYQFSIQNRQILFPVDERTTKTVGEVRRVSVRTSIIGWSGEWQATDDLRKSNRAPKFRRVCSDKTSHGRWTGGTASNVDSSWEVSTVAHSLIRHSTLSAAIRQIGLVFNEHDDSRGRVEGVGRFSIPSATSVVAHLPSISADLREIEEAPRFRVSWKPINCTRAFSSRAFNAGSVGICRNLTIFPRENLVVVLSLLRCTLLGRGKRKIVLAKRTLQNW